LPVPAGAADAADAQGKRLVEEACTQCHGLYPVISTRDGGPGWRDTVQKMVIIGAQLNREEIDRIVTYLAAEYGPGAGPMPTGILPADSALEVEPGTTGEEVELPAGDGKELVQGYCGMCHDLGRIVVNRMSAAAWRRYTQNMLAQAGIAAGEAELNRMVNYLASHFGPRAD
jgi:cytochrome c5